MRFDIAFPFTIRPSNEGADSRSSRTVRFEVEAANEEEAVMYVKTLFTMANPCRTVSLPPTSKKFKCRARLSGKARASDQPSVCIKMSGHEGKHESSDGWVWTPERNEPFEASDEDVSLSDAEELSAVRLTNLSVAARYYKLKGDSGWLLRAADAYADAKDQEGVAVRTSST